MNYNDSINIKRDHIPIAFRMLDNEQFAKYKLMNT